MVFILRLILVAGLFLNSTSLELSVEWTIYVWQYKRCWCTDSLVVSPMDTGWTATGREVMDVDDVDVNDNEPQSVAMNK